MESRSLTRCRTSLGSYIMDETVHRLLSEHQEDKQLILALRIGRLEHKEAVRDRLGEIQRKIGEIPASNMPLPTKGIYIVSLLSVTWREYAAKHWSILAP